MPRPGHSISEALARLEELPSVQESVISGDSSDDEDISEETKEDIYLTGPSQPVNMTLKKKQNYKSAKSRF